MVKKMKSCLQQLMKIFNSIVGIAGFAMIMYGLWLIRVWQSGMDGSSSGDQTSFPWFIHAFIGLGISFCAITCLGHFAAHTAHSHFLSCYVSIMFLLLFLETVVMVDIIPKSEWEKDLPEDPTGRFDDFKDFVESNLDICKWVGVLIVLAQGVSILLATVIKTLKIDMGIYYDIEADSAPQRLPYLNTPVEQLPGTIGGPYFAFTNYYL